MVYSPLIAIFFALYGLQIHAEDGPCPSGADAIGEAKERLDITEQATWDRPHPSLVSRTGQAIDANPVVGSPVIMRAARPKDIPNDEGTVVIGQNLKGVQKKSWRSRWNVFNLATQGDPRRVLYSFGENVGNVLGFYSSRIKKVLAIPENPQRLNKGIEILNKYLEKWAKIRITYNEIDETNEYAFNLAYIKGTTQDNFTHPYSSTNLHVTVHDASHHVAMIALPDELLTQVKRNSNAVLAFLDFIDDQIASGALARGVGQKIKEKMAQMHARVIDAGTGNFGSNFPTDRTAALQNAYALLGWNGASTEDYIGDLLNILKKENFPAFNEGDIIKDDRDVSYYFFRNYYDTDALPDVSQEVLKDLAENFGKKHIKEKDMFYKIPLLYFHDLDVFTSKTQKRFKEIQQAADQARANGDIPSN